MGHAAEFASCGEKCDIDGISTAASPTMTSDIAGRITSTINSPSSISAAESSEEPNPRSQQIDVNAVWPTRTYHLLNAKTEVWSTASDCRSEIDETQHDEGKTQLMSSWQLATAIGLLLRQPPGAQTGREHHS